jgi:hypothetical protein
MFASDKLSNIMLKNPVPRRHEPFSDVKNEQNPHQNEPETIVVDDSDSQEENHWTDDEYNGSSSDFEPSQALELPPSDVNDDSYHEESQNGPELSDLSDSEGEGSGAFTTLKGSRAERGISKWVNQNWVYEDIPIEDFVIDDAEDLPSSDGDFREFDEIVSAASEPKGKLPKKSRQSKSTITGKSTSIKKRATRPKRVIHDSDSESDAKLTDDEVQHNLDVNDLLRSNPASQDQKNVPEHQTVTEPPHGDANQEPSKTENDILKPPKPDPISERTRAVKNPLNVYSSDDDAEYDISSKKARNGVAVITDIPKSPKNEEHKPTSTSRQNSEDASSIKVPKVISKITELYPHGKKRQRKSFSASISNAKNAKDRTKANMKPPNSHDNTNYSFDNDTNTSVPQLKAIAADNSIEKTRVITNSSQPTMFQSVRKIIMDTASKFKLTGSPDTKPTDSIINLKIPTDSETVNTQVPIALNTPIPEPTPQITSKVTSTQSFNIENNKSPDDVHAGMGSQQVVKNANNASVRQSNSLSNTAGVSHSPPETPTRSTERLNRALYQFPAVKNAPSAKKSNSVASRPAISHPGTSEKLSFLLNQPAELSTNPNFKSSNGSKIETKKLHSDPITQSDNKDPSVNPSSLSSIPNSTAPLSDSSSQQHIEPQSDSAFRNFTSAQPNPEPSASESSSLQSNLHPLPTPPSKLFQKDAPKAQPLFVNESESEDEVMNSWRLDAENIQVSASTINHQKLAESIEETDSPLVPRMRKRLSANAVLNDSDDLDDEISDDDSDDDSNDSDIEVIDYEQFVAK